MQAVNKMARMQYLFSGALFLTFFLFSCNFPVYKVDEFQPRIRPHPTEADKFFNEGYAYFILQQWKESTADFEQAVKLNPEDGESFFYLGIDYVWLGMDEKARTAFSRAFSLGNNYGASHEQMSLVYRARGEKEQEMAVLRQAIAEQDPHPVFLRYNMGRLYREAGQDDSTIAIFEEAIRLDAVSSGEYGMFHHIGEIYRSRGDLGNAIAMYEQQIKYPKFSMIASTYYNLGVVYFAISDYPHAITAFSGAVEKDPLDASSLYNLAVTYLLAGQQEKVPPLRERLRLLDPEMADELDTIIQKYSEKKN